MTVDTAHQVNPQLGAIVQNEVPRPVARPWQYPINAAPGEGDEERLEMSGRQPQVEVGVLPRLLPQERVDAPTASDARIDAMLFERLEGPTHTLWRRLTY